MVMKMMSIRIAILSLESSDMEMEGVYFLIEMAWPALPETERRGMGVYVVVQMAAGR